MVKYKVRGLKVLMNLSGWSGRRVMDLGGYLAKSTAHEDCTMEEWAAEMMKWEDRIDPLFRLQMWIDNRLGKAYQKARRERLVRGA